MCYPSRDAKASSPDRPASVEHARPSILAVAGENELAGGTGDALVLYRESLPYAMHVISPDPGVMAKWDLL